MCDALSRNLPQLPEKLEIIVGHCLAHARRRFVEVTPNFPEPCRYVLEALGEVYRNDARAQPMTRRAVTFPATAQRPGLGRTSRLAHRPVRGKESGAELRSGNGDPVSAQALGAAHAVSAAARGTSGQQHLRAGVEESHPASQKLFVLQDREWGPHRRPVHEPDSHLRTVRRQPLRLPDPVAAACWRVSTEPVRVDALELSRDDSTNWHQPGFRVAYDESRLAANHRFRPYAGATRRWPENGPLGVCRE